MTIVVTKQLESDMKAIMATFSSAYAEAKDLYDLYWSQVDSDAGYTALLTTQAATLTSKLTKQEMINSVTLFQHFVKFVENDTASSADYMDTIQSVIYGNNAIVTALSNAIEDYGDRAVLLCQTLLQLDKDCRNANNFYNDSEVAAAAAVLSAQTIVFGADMTQDDLVSGQAMFLEYLDLINNGTLTNGDYMSTIQKWQRLQ